MENTLQSLFIDAIALSQSHAAEAKSPAETERVSYHTPRIDRLNLFYPEDGGPAHPAIVPPHGFPSSSHLYRNFIPLPARKYQLIAAGMPGFGQSNQPSVDKFTYPFDHRAEVADKLLDSRKLDRYAINNN
jgi:pimeloyl-ACP methyl ester carboxylesterase